MSVIGVDLGGTKVAVARLDGRELDASLVQPTDRSGAAGLLAQVAAMVQSVRGDEHEAVGIGVPSVVDLETGRVVSSVNVPLGELPLRDLLADRLDAPVYVDNDATVAAFAEAHDDQLRLMADNLVMITIGTGIGGGLVLGGRIYRGRTGGAGELGHTLVGMDLAVTVAAPVGFPQPGSLERLTAGQALGRLAEQAAAADPNSALGQRRARSGPLVGADVVQAARAGDATAVRVIELWGERVGIGVANAINTFDPDEVVIGGGAAQAGELLLEPARREQEDSSNRCAELEAPTAVRTPGLLRGPQNDHGSVRRNAACKSADFRIRRRGGPERVRRQSSGLRRSAELCGPKTGKQKTARFAGHFLSG